MAGAARFAAAPMCELALKTGPRTCPSVVRSSSRGGTDRDPAKRRPLCRRQVSVTLDASREPAEFSSSLLSSLALGGGKAVRLLGKRVNGAHAQSVGRCAPYNRATRASRRRRPTRRRSRTPAPAWACQPQPQKKALRKQWPQPWRAWDRRTWHSVRSERERLSRARVSCRARRGGRRSSGAASSSPSLFSLGKLPHSLLHSGQLECVRSHLKMHARWNLWPGDGEPLFLGWLDTSSTARAASCGRWRTCPRR